MKKDYTASRHTNRKMNDETYALRRVVMGYIYEAKALLGDKFKRVDVRITDCSEACVMGTARMGGCIIWIPASTIKDPALVIRHVVFHELAHAVFNAEHNSRCPLMRPVIGNTTKAQQDKALVKIAA